ncbi:MAG: ATP-dependent helicase HrpB, partial [Gammaproteobacteria bacterium]
DEFHERNLASDLGLALALDVQQALRPELRIVVMSATLDGPRLADFLGAATVSAPGRSYPVEVRHFPARRDERLEQQLCRAVLAAFGEVDGDILCFLPGRAEIERARRALEGLPALAAELVTLHGELGLDEQARVLAPQAHRRVVLATNVAESSLTLPGVRAVIDSGLAREPRFDPVSGMSRLATVTVTQPSATQRAGRAGRIAPGLCLRLWPEGQLLEAATRPEIAQVELSGFVLELRAWGSDALRLLDPPPPGSLAQAETLLSSLGALDAQGRITAHGRALLALGSAPRLANAVLSVPSSLRPLACDVCALLEGRDPLRGAARRDDDLAARLDALAAWRAKRAPGDADRHALRAIDTAARTWQRRLGLARTNAEPPAAHAVGRVLAHAYPDRIACRDATDALRYRLANGRGARLAEDSALAGEPWLAVADLRFDSRDSRVLLAAPLDPGDLEADFAGAFTRRVVRRFDAATRAVDVREERRFMALVIESRKMPAPRDADTASALAAGVLALGLDCLPWSENLRDWQARVTFLRAHCPELGLPDVGDAALVARAGEWLEPALFGRTRLGELDGAEFAALLTGQLDHAQRQALAEHAPEAITVPSGSRKRLSYTQGDAPVLAVKLQELFGLADGPRVARGRVAVVLHLLSPRQAPIQVTRDLGSFWSNTYPEVKKALKGRYPKHPWPDDPWTATPTARTQRRR